MIVSHVINRLRLYRWAFSAIFPRSIWLYHTENTEREIWHNLHLLDSTVCQMINIEIPVIKVTGGPLHLNNKPPLVMNLLFLRFTDSSDALDDSFWTEETSVGKIYTIRQLQIIDPSTVEPAASNRSLSAVQTWMIGRRGWWLRSSAACSDRPGD